jgi:hypothetical protein
MAGKLWCIHTLNSGDAIAEITCMCCKQGVFKHISAFLKIIKEEIGTCIFRAFIITKPTLVFVAAQYIYRLQR